MEELIFQKIQEYDTDMNFKISFTDRPLPIGELISLYRFRNKMAKDEHVIRLTQQILNGFLPDRKTIL